MRIIAKDSTMVKPTAETPSGSLWLSNLDLLLPSNYHTRLVFFYHSDGAANFFDAAVLKAALSRALLEFYPMAGRLTIDDNNRLAIDCNSEGVLFVEAECDCAVADLGDFAPKPEPSLIPAVDYSRGISTFPLSLIQLTRFKCGGVCLGIANEHHLSDGTSFFHFFTTWANIARGLTTTAPPFLDRRILSARSPPRPRFSHIEYEPPPPLKTPLHNSETSFSIFKLTRDHLDALKAQCNEGNGPKYTTYEVVSAHVWRCLCKARGLARNQETKLHVPVNGRPRLRPPLPSGYFGNVVFSARPVASCGELVSNPLKFAVGKVHEAIARMDDDYLRSDIDYLELQGDVCAGVRGPHLTKCPNLGIVSWLRLPIYVVDFGWGKPVYMGTGATAFEGRSYLLHSADNDGSLLLAITLLKEHMKLFEKLFYEGIFHAKL